MKKSLLWGLMAISLLFSACEDVELPDRYIAFNGAKIDMEVATISDGGTNKEITHRNYRLNFSSSDFQPRYHFYFDIYSPSTTRLQEGVYTYHYEYDKGSVSQCEIGMDLRYDNTGVAISGTRFDDEIATFTGTITISKKNDNYLFEFDLEAEYNGETHFITGVFNEVLTEVYTSTN